MKAKVIKETPSTYLIEVAREGEEHEPVFVQRSGKPLAILIPYEEYQDYKAWKASRTPKPRYPAFEAEVAAFESLKPELLTTYRDKIVAIYQGKVIEVGDDRMDVLGQVIKNYGYVQCYIEQVTAETPRRVRIPSTWRKKDVGI